MTIAQGIQVLKNKLATTSDAESQAVLIKEILMEYVRLRSGDGMPYTDRLLQLAQSLDSIYYHAWALFHKSVIARFTSDNDTSIKLAWQAHALFSEIDDRIGMGNCLNSIGNCHEELCNYAESLKAHLQALRIREELGDKVGIANSRNNLALVYEQLKDFDTALDYFNQALELMTEAGNKQGMANAFTNIGNIHLQRGEYDDALKNYLCCREIEYSSGNEYGIAIADANLAALHQACGRFEEALPLMQSSRLVFEAKGNKHMNGQLMNNIGELYAKIGKYELALSFFLSGLEISEEITARLEIYKASEGLMQGYRAIGEYEKALKHYDRYHQVEKEMTGQQVQREIAELNYQHETELKEKEAQLLKEKNEAVNIYAQKLEVSNNELKQFAHVASHDLREPLRMVTSYMQLLEQTMGEEIKPIQRQFIGFAVDGARRMEQLIHDLLRLAKVDANPQIERVSLPSVIDEVRNNLEILLREKNARILSGQLPEIMADRTQIMQLFQNIISNGIKYNESVEPTISIGFQVRETDALLSIADNGIGIPPDYREKAFQIFQRVPTAKAYQGSGIGLAICKKIVDGLGGNIAIDDHDGGGTVFYITIPLGLICE